jgi:hypothetical protein
MNNILFKCLLVSLVMLLGISCQSSNKQNDEFYTDETISGDDSLMLQDDINMADGSIPIFYNMYLSVEMTSLFENIGAGYEPHILNPIEKSDEYLMSTKKAMNLGVYAVDLSYTKVFQEYDRAGKYLSTMHELSEELGIPSEHFINTTRRIENNITNKDSLYKIANEIYMTTDNYLKENDREGAAALIVMGGWIEAMYIASKIYESGVNDADFLSRVADQKYSLKDLIDLLDDYAEDDTISKYLPKLKALKEDFKSFTVDYDNTQPAIKSMEEVVPSIQEIRNDIVS